MLATLSASIPSGPGWTFEIKWDGFRALGAVRGGETMLLSRTGNDLTGRFPSVARALPGALRSPECTVDGEVVAFDGTGRPSFAELQRGGPRLAYYVFDLLELDGDSLVELPWRERRRRLEALLDPSEPSVQLSAAFEDGEALFAAAREQRLEGVIAKRVDSRYRAGKRTRDWLKVKVHERQELVIAGYTRGAGRRTGALGALVLAVHEGGELRWAGNCGTGFTDTELEALLARLQPLERATPPFRVAPRMPRVRPGEVVWVEPVLVCEVEFAEWTPDGKLRAPSYRGLREDKPVAAVRRERPPEEEVCVGRHTLRLGNQDKLFWPGEGITKGDLLDYYRRIAPVLVPHLRARPFTMKRFPDGIEGGHFFQKDAPSHMPAWIATRPFPATSRAGKRSRTIRYPLVNDELALLWMVNMGCIDLNVWLSRVDRPDRPDAVLFDLDPAEGTPFEAAVEVALLVKQLLDLVGLASYPKTSGADGIHVLVPVTRRSTFADSRDLAAIVAATLARTHPALVTTEWARAKRRGVLVDANQNREGATIASVYSVRPHPGAPVSTPLRWDELTPSLDPRAFTMGVVLDRVAAAGDLFAPALGGAQSIRKALDSLRG
ncbi:MAG: DNA ligase D [Gaiellales bacterium]